MSCLSRAAKEPHSSGPVVQTLKHAIAGAIAGGVVEAALYPLDTIKTRLQVARSGGKLVLKGLYSGLGGNLIGVFPSTAIFFATYEPLKQALRLYISRYYA